MKKYDCSKILDYIHERGRVCNTVGKCDNCPLYASFCCDVGDATQEGIDALQRWSDEHPEIQKLTKREREFLTAFMPHIKGRAIERTAKGLYIIFHHAFNGEADGYYIDPDLFPFIGEGDEWYFDKLLGLEVIE